MPSKKKKKNPPVKSQPARRSPDNYDLIKKVIFATITSSAIMLGLSAWLVTMPEQAAAGSSRLFQFMPPFVGILGALFARPVRETLKTNASETVHAVIISGVVSLLVTGLVVLFS